jgi:SAM-dependent methyltransferase
MTATTVKHRLTRQPVRAALAGLLRIAPQLRPRVQELVWRGVYEAASFGRRNLVTTMNYGYATAGESPPRLQGRGDPFGLQLYGAVAGAADLTGKDVLEVGCGRGGGAGFMVTAFRPRSMVGLDLAKTAIDRCRATEARTGLDFVVGQADNLPFADAAFDVIVSIESTHCYPDVPRFLSEARRVLRPHGVLALADFRRIDATPSSTDGSTQDPQSLRDQLLAAGFRVREEEDITDNVVRALALNTPAVRARIERRFPRFLRQPALEFAGVAGSTIYRDFTERRLVYLRFALQRD